MKNQESKKTFEIEFIGEKKIGISKGQSILDASLKAGIPHFHDCGGKAKCTTCRILVKQGMENLTPPTPREERLKRKLPIPPNVRLACQTYVEGDDVSVHRIIRDVNDIMLYEGMGKEDEYHHIGKEKDLALFFLDVRNFTPFMEAYVPFDVIHIMRKLFRIFQNNIRENNGKIIDTAGDGLYAVFGLKTQIAEAAKSAVKAGLSILSELDDYNNKYFHPYFNLRFELGIGVHCGKVIVGNIGLGINNNLTVMGLPVNIAARLQEATKQLNNSFVISDDTFKHLDFIKGPTNKHWVTLKGIKNAHLVHLLGSPYINS